MERESYWIGYEKGYGMESDKAQLERKRKDKRWGRERHRKDLKESITGKKIKRLSLKG